MVPWYDHKDSWHGGDTPRCKAQSLVAHKLLLKKKIQPASIINNNNDYIFFKRNIKVAQNSFEHNHQTPINTKLRHNFSFLLLQSGTRACELQEFTIPDHICKDRGKYILYIMQIEYVVKGKCRLKRVRRKVYWHSYSHFET